MRSCDQRENLPNCSARKLLRHCRFHVYVHYTGGHLVHCFWLMCVIGIVTNYKLSQKLTGSDEMRLLSLAEIRPTASPIRSGRLSESSKLDSCRLLTVHLKDI